MLVLVLEELVLVLMWRWELVLVLVLVWKEVGVGQHCLLLGEKRLAMRYQGWEQWL